MKKIWSVLIAAIILRLFLSFFTSHPDLEALAAGGKIVSQGNILNLYDQSSDALVLNYPPLIYWFFGFFNLFLGGLLALLKLPYLFFDLMIGFLLMRMVEPKKGVFIFGIWMFNPVNLYSTYMMGQFDIIPTFFSILSIYFAFKNKLNYAALALGMGIAFKLYPVFLIIPLVLLGSSIKDKLKILLLTALPYILSILPYVSSESFRSTALLANQSSKSLYASIPVSGGEAILLFPAFLIFFYLLILRQANKASLWKFYLIPLLLFFTLTHYHPQWLIWMTPFLILDLVVSGFKNIVPVVLIFGSWFGSLFFFDPSLTLGMFAPLNPSLKTIPDIWTLLNINMDFNFSRSMLQTILAGSSIYLIFHFLSNKENA